MQDRSDQTKVMFPQSSNPTPTVDAGPIATVQAFQIQYLLLYKREHSNTIPKILLAAASKVEICSTDLLSSADLLLGRSF